MLPRVKGWIDHVLGCHARRDKQMRRESLTHWRKMRSNGQQSTFPPWYWHSYCLIAKRWHGLGRAGSSESSGECAAAVSA